MAVFAKPESYAPTSCYVKIQGKTLPPTAIVDVAVHENLAASAQFTLTLQEGLDRKIRQFTWLDNSLLDPGNEIEIYLGYAGAEKCLFKGTIMALRPNFTSTGIASLTVEGYDISQRMASGKKKIKDEQVKYSDIAEQLAKAYALKTKIEDSKTQYLKVARKPNEHDYQFLQRLAESEGFECFVQTDYLQIPIRDTLYFRKPQDTKTGQTPVKTFEYGKNLVGFTPRLSTASLKQEVIVTDSDHKAEQIKATATLDEMSLDSEVAKSLKKFLPNAQDETSCLIESQAVKSEAKAKQMAVVELKKILNNFIQGGCGMYRGYNPQTWQ
jgi:phage protein D